MTLPIAAGIDVGAIIWVLILIFWAIAQVIQRSRPRAGRGRPPAPPMRPRPPATPMESELRDILEQLSGRAPVRPTEEEDPTVDLEEIEVEPVQRPSPPVRPPAVRRPAPPAPSRRPTPAMPPLQAAIAPVAEMSTLAEELAASHVVSVGRIAPPRSVVLGSQNAVLHGMTFHVPTGFARLGVPSLTLSELRQPRTFARAMLARMVLEPPKALERPGGSLSGF